MQLNRDRSYTNASLQKLANHRTVVYVDELELLPSLPASSSTHSPEAVEAVPAPQKQVTIVALVPSRCHQSSFSPIYLVVSCLLPYHTICHVSIKLSSNQRSLLAMLRIGSQEPIVS